MTKYCSHTFRKIVTTYDWRNGSTIRTYRLRCKSCDFTWTVHFDTSIQKEVEVSKMSDKRPLNQKRLTPAEVRLVLLDKRSNRALAKYLSVSPQTVSQVRNGQSYRNLWPELPRIPSTHICGPKKTKPKPPPVVKPIEPRQRAPKKVEPKKVTLYCKDCTHWWQKRCGLDIPEAGNTFAKDCSFYQAED